MLLTYAARCCATVPHAQLCTSSACKFSSCCSNFVCNSSKSLSKGALKLLTTPLLPLDSKSQSPLHIHVHQ
jgi:hypothetical protein